jgi:hypothetical protein
VSNVSSLPFHLLNHCRDTALLLNLTRKRLQQCCARTTMWPTVQRDQIIL